MRSDDVPLAIFRDAVFLQCLRVRNNETTFLLREMNAIEGRDTMAVEDDTAGYRGPKVYYAIGRFRALSNCKLSYNRLLYLRDQGV
jgi:hypothetical protein